MKKYTKRHTRALHGTKVDPHNVLDLCEMDDFEPELLEVILKRFHNGFPLYTLAFDGRDMGVLFHGAKGWVADCATLDFPDYVTSSQHAGDWTVTLEQATYTPMFKVLRLAFKLESCVTGNNVYMYWNVDKKWGLEECVAIEKHALSDDHAVDLTKLMIDNY